jgi:hypothetical protein
VLKAAFAYRPYGEVYASPGSEVGDTRTVV